MKIRYPLILALLLISMGLAAQNVTLESATSQWWAGGQCCTQGVIYRIQLQAKTAGPRFQVDTLWVKDQPYPITQFNITRNAAGDTAGFNCHIQGSYRWGRPGDWQYDFEEKRVAVPEKPKFEGAALLVYRMGGRRHLLSIPAFAELPTIAYP